MLVSCTRQCEGTDGIRAFALVPLSAALSRDSANALLHAASPRERESVFREELVVALLANCARTLASIRPSRDAPPPLSPTTAATIVILSAALLEVDSFLSPRRPPLLAKPRLASEPHYAPATVTSLRVV